MDSLAGTRAQGADPEGRTTRSHVGIGEAWLPLHAALALLRTSATCARDFSFVRRAARQPLDRRTVGGRHSQSSRASLPRSPRPSQLFTVRAYEIPLTAPRAWSATRPERASMASRVNFRLEKGKAKHASETEPDKLTLITFASHAATSGRNVRGVAGRASDFAARRWHDGSRRARGRSRRRRQRYESPLCVPACTGM